MSAVELLDRTGRMRPAKALGLLDADTVSRLARRLTGDLEFQRCYRDLDDAAAGELARRIIDQAIAFVVTVGKSPGCNLAPSLDVDLGWHTFVLYTREYSSFCEEVVGRFVHHDPSDRVGVSYPAADLVATTSAIAQAGFELDLDLWQTTKDQCCGRG